MNDVILNKIQSIQRCIRRAREEYRAAGTHFPEDYTRQDAAILNVTRACEQAIDLANHVVKTAKLGIPTDSAESFDLLVQAQIITRDLAGKLRKMIGFRNTVIHQDQTVEVSIVGSVIERSLDDLVAFTERIASWKPPA